MISKRSAFPLSLHSLPGAIGGWLSLILCLTLLSRESHSADLADQLGVMVQLENMLETCPNNHFGARAKEVERQFELMHEAGVRWTRVGVMWNQIEPKKGQWNWAAVDTIVHAAKKHRITILWLVGNTAPWDSTNHEWNGVPADLHDPNGHFPHFVRELVQRYKSEIHYWEIRNEPNLDYMWHGRSPAAFAAYLTQAHDTIKHLDPTAHVVMGGLGGSVPQQVKWFKELMGELKGRKGSLPFEIANFHIYGGEADSHGFRGKESVVKYLDHCEKEIDKCMKELGLAEMPWWSTEFDYPAGPKRQSDDPDYHHGPASQAAFVRELFPRLVRDHPERKLFWASLLDDFNDEGFETIGLIQSDKDHRIGPPRPAYEALKELLKREK